jgi:DNA-binding transcriptional ArsR family regulator
MAGTVRPASQPARGDSRTDGRNRARLLDTLRSPATTSALARQYAVTPGTVSQHLGALSRARLLTRQRSGDTVLYQTSDLGLAPLGVTDVKCTRFARDYAVAGRTGT